MMRIRVLAIAPYEGIKAMIEKVAKNYPEIDLTAMTGDLDEGVALAQNNFHSDYDVIISRGGTAQLLRMKVDIPVIEIPITEHDLIKALNLADAGSNSFAIAGFPNVTSNAKFLSAISASHAPLRLYTIHRQDEVDMVIDSIWNDGYRSVLCDVVASVAARKRGMNAFLITSGPESIQKALEDTIFTYECMQNLKKENHFLRNVITQQSSETVVFDERKNLYFSTVENDQKDEILAMLSGEISHIEGDGSVRLVKSLNGMLYTIKAQKIVQSPKTFYTFYFTRSKTPFSVAKSGVHFYSSTEAREIYYKSFFSSAGEIFGLEDDVRLISASQNPVLLLGEEGTGKESVSMILYSRSNLNKHPYVVINCALVNEKTWQYLQENYNSPFAASKMTIYISELGALSDEQQKQLLALLIDMDVCTRNRVIFSFAASPDGEALPARVRHLADKLCCLTIRVPSLRERKDSIPALINLYLSQLSMSQVTEIIGMQSGAAEIMRDFPWPNNLAQFKRVLQELVATSRGPLIKEADVNRVLLLESSSPVTASPAYKPTRFDLDRTLAEMDEEIVRRVYEANNCNQSLAAKKLGISRTTLWRYLKK